MTVPDGQDPDTMPGKHMTLAEVHTTQQTTFTVPGQESNGFHSLLTGTYKAVMNGQPICGVWGAIPYGDHAPGDDDLTWIILNPVHMVYVEETKG